MADQPISAPGRARLERNVLSVPHGIALAAAAMAPAIGVVLNAPAAAPMYLEPLMRMCPGGYLVWLLWLLSQSCHGVALRPQSRSISYCYVLK